ncbi:acyltransferase family protein [Anditalea andensis]|uniref:Membrane protein n=1 Tax=Anditalea andensis TaxID=1048983 RepID=A0A074KZT8_9BACT|nr:DUF5009 domain-containing protein [Anditalea andensis]KEO75511.1 membrane protein [Anditalea andensis]
MQNVIPIQDHPSSTLTERYLSLDVLRGMTIALMIIVNTPGSWQHIYPPLRHAAWHGFTVTDLVFPMFLFVIGNAMSFSMAKYAKMGDRQVIEKILKRAGIIFLLGLLLNAFPFITRSAEGELVLKDFSALRIMGVLQRIALCYLIAGLLIHYLKLKGALLMGGIILLSYWIVMWYYGEVGHPYSLEGNAALKFDIWIFAEKHLYKGFGIPFDPEGLLSTIPAAVNIIGGYWAGRLIQGSRSLNYKTGLFIFIALAMLAVGWWWDVIFPINKPIWTSSYVLYTLGWSFLSLAILIVIIEKYKAKNWTYFFEVFGKNPLFIFILSGALIKTMGIISISEMSLNAWIYQHFFLVWTEGKPASLLFAVFYMLLLWFIGLWLMKNRIYIKV